MARPRIVCQSTGIATMQMTLEEARKRFPDGPRPAPLEYAGQWVAWNKERTCIVAHGARFGEVRAAAIAAGCAEPLMQRLLGESFVGET
jgi:hypothetical protein